MSDNTGMSLNTETTVRARAQTEPATDSIAASDQPETAGQGPSGLASAQSWPNASRGKRFAAMMYEGVLLFGVVFSADLLFDVLSQSKHALMLRPERQAFLFAAIGLYFILCWYRGGQTLPMRAWHIKLVNAQGYKPTLKQLFWRYVLLWPIPLAGMALIYALVWLTGWPAIYMFAIVTPFLVFIPSWFASDGQFLHDRVIGTRIADIPEHLRRAASQKKSS